MIDSKKLCPMFCGGKDLVVDNGKEISEDDLLILNEKKRMVYFSMVENKPINPLVALVGLCPGYNQISKLVEIYNKIKNFETARENASFNKANSNISKMLRKIKIDEFLGIKIRDDFDFNSSDFFLTTSLVKCASLKLGKGRSDEFDLLKFNFSLNCIKNRFVKDILYHKSLKKIIFFGKKAERIIQEKLIGGESIKEILERENKEIIILPHPSGSNNGGVARFLRK